MPLQTPEQAGDPSTYWSQSIRMMPLANIDPSLAIGFYCKTSGAASIACVHPCICVTPFASSCMASMGPVQAVVQLYLLW